MDLHAQLIEAIFTFSRNLKGKMSYDSSFCHISMLQLQALLFLKKNPHAQMSDIAAHFRIELSSATSLMNTLTKLRLVQRKVDDKDRRLVRISLTIEGEKMLTDAMKERSKKIAETLKHLSSEEKKSFLTIMQKLIAKMEGAHEK